MTDPTQLSPAAQAVKDAVLATYADNIPKDDNLWALERASTVAALRAAIDQVMPEPSDAAKALFSLAAVQILYVIRDDFHAIATELENHD